MATDFDNFEEFEDDDLDDEFTPEEIAEFKRGEQDAMMGFAYEMVDSEEGFAFKCGKCGRVTGIHERPFPHRFGCPMAKYEEDSD